MCCHGAIPCLVALGGARYPIVEPVWPLLFADCGVVVAAHDVECDPRAIGRNSRRVQSNMFYPGRAGRPSRNVRYGQELLLEMNVLRNN